MNARLALYLALHVYAWTPYAMGGQDVEALCAAGGAGSAVFCWRAGTKLLKQTPLTKKNVELAVTFLAKGCAVGDSGSCRDTGAMMFLLGNYSIAKEYFERSCQMNRPGEKCPKAGWVSECRKGLMRSCEIVAFEAAMLAPQARSLNPFLAQVMGSPRGRVSKAEAQTHEQRLRKNPNDFESRAALLAWQNERSLSSPDGGTDGEYLSQATWMLENHPEDERFYSHIGLALAGANAGDRARLIAILKKTIETDKRPAALFNSAQALWVWETEIARRTLEKVRTLDPHYPGLDEAIKRLVVAEKRRKSAPPKHDVEALLAKEKAKTTVSLDRLRARVKLGDAYKNGVGVKTDGKQAIAWYEKAAGAKAESPAHFTLILLAESQLCHSYGVGSPETYDAKTAVRWCSSLARAEERAREADFTKSWEAILQQTRAHIAQAQDNLGYYYFHGEGVEKNEALSKEWMDKSAQLGGVPGTRPPASVDSEGF